MKRYWLFAGDSYYPYGGMGDFIRDFDSQEEASKEGEKYDWMMVFDCVECTVNGFSLEDYRRSLRL